MIKWYTAKDFWNKYDGTKSPVDNTTNNVDGKWHNKAVGKFGNE